MSCWPHSVHNVSFFVHRYKIDCELETAMGIVRLNHVRECRCGFMPSCTFDLWCGKFVLQLECRALRIPDKHRNPDCRHQSLPNSLQLLINNGLNIEIFLGSKSKCRASLVSFHKFIIYTSKFRAISDSQIRTKINFRFFFHL